ncbi:MAG: glucosidase [Oligoflexia bacterium]|nr:glucosidase [Oligoflexia bacterium]
MAVDAETLRLEEDRTRQKNWKRWGPYLPERQWGTVREDYSADGACWDYLPHDHARSRAYRWGEDGLLGFTDRQCRLCFAFAFWNGQDPILKERVFGLTGPEGNHGEDVKEYYYYLDSVPTHSYCKALYKYPQRAFPYSKLVAESKRRSREQPEYELVDTGIFADNRYFDISIEYAKAGPDDILIRLTVLNRGSEAAILHALPSLWFRNTWSWGREGEGYTSRPRLSLHAPGHIRSEHETLGRFALVVDQSALTEQPVALFTENETNVQRLFGSNLANAYVKDAFHEYVISQRGDAVNPKQVGTKAAFLSKLVVPAGANATLKLRLFSENSAPIEPFGVAFDKIFDMRIREADEFYAVRMPPKLSADEAQVMRQAYAGLLWSKQFYYYSVQEWLEGDPSQPPPAPSRKNIRNSDWSHLYNRDVISMPDKWEYPWYAAWDLAFHMIPFARIDPAFAKQQLVLMLREWYMHPNGQIPAYEFAFSDVNPPVHAWACWRVYKISGARGKRDRHFLARTFHKLLLNFTWWVNRKDIGGKNLFSGGFLGLDNIGVFDRSQPLPVGGHLEQADATAWMAFYCLTMLSMSLELASEDPAYSDVASKFFEHFVSITDAINTLGGSGLWDQLDGFYYDQLHADGKTVPLRTRSIVGIIPLLAVEVLEEEKIEKLPGFKRRMEWFLRERKDLARHITYMEHSGPRAHGHNLLAVPSRQRLERVLRYLLDENEFLSPFGVRSLSRVHESYPYIFRVGNQEYRVDYTPGESNTVLFGGNSNWRGPVWFPINYLLIEALERYHHFYGDDLIVDCPTGSGNRMNLKQVSQELSRRLTSLFVSNERGERPYAADLRQFAGDPAWKDAHLFFEYFHPETGRGCGASHQTGWTALVTRCLEKMVAARDQSLAWPSLYY